MSEPRVHPPYPEDGDRRAHAAWAAHLEGCASCRAETAASDPTRLFALLGRRPLPPAALDDVAAAVARALADEAPERSGRVVAARLTAATAAVALAVAGTLLSIDTDPRRASTRSRPERAHVTVLDAEPDTQVVDLTLGDTQVVMIYDARVRP